MAANASLGAQTGRACVLALIAGYVDAYALIGFQVFASFMSGNTTQSGVGVGQGDWARAGHNLLPIPLFVLGVFVGTLMAHAGPARLRRTYLLVAAALMLAWSAGHWDLPGWSSIVALALAMGLMNTAITRIGPLAVSVGYVTGSLNNLGRHLALALRREPVDAAADPGDTHARRAALLAGLWTAFLLGAILGCAVAVRYSLHALLPPVVILLVLAALNGNVPGKSR